MTSSMASAKAPADAKRSSGSLARARKSSVAHIVGDAMGGPIDGREIGVADANEDVELFASARRAAGG